MSNIVGIGRPPKISAARTREAEGVRTKVWPWENYKARLHKWSTTRIRKILADHLADQNLTTRPEQADIVTALATAHYRLLQARCAIEADPVEPVIGKRCAYIVEEAAERRIAAMWRMLGIKTRTAPASESDKPAPAAGLAPETFG